MNNSQAPAMRTTITIAILLCGLSTAEARYLGNLPPGQQPPEVSPNPYGSGYQLCDSQGQYRGTLNSNPYDPNRATNPYGRHGSLYSRIGRTAPTTHTARGLASIATRASTSSQRF
jgi:hypothetical protein